MKSYLIKPTLFAIIIVLTFFYSCQTKKTESVIIDDTDNEITEFISSQDTLSYWKSKLTENQYYIMVEQGTERPFTNQYFDNHKKGVYVSAATGKPLFSSNDKFDSGTGWPAFSKPINDKAVTWIKDTSLGMTRNEVVEKETGLHLGHVFDDGPKPTGLRYCINSGALKFVAEE